MDRNPNRLSSSSDFLRSVQAAIKGHRSFRPTQSNIMLPRRALPKQETSKSDFSVDTNKSIEVAPKIQNSDDREDASLTPPPISGTMTKFGSQVMDDEIKDIGLNVSSCVDPKHDQMVGGIKKVKFSLANSGISQGDGGMSSCRLGEMEWEAVNEGKHQNGVNSEGTRMPLQHLSNFLQNDSVASSTCATTISVHATSAPRRNSTTHSTCPHKDIDSILLGPHADRLLSGAQASSSLPHVPITPNHSDFVKDTDASTAPPPCPSSKDLSSLSKLDTTKSDKQDKPPPRKKGYDPDLFFKVNGKLYQRLGKIGSGGSSEVHKVISSDCTIYALKKIKLKGRDYSTALGFCQEIVYLKKLKGKDNIIQLIDYEVTDKSLLQEVMDGPSSNNKDNKVKDDGFIYMVLEYGEIDLARMLSQKWKEMERCNSTMDENWLRFYWQQILLAVNTIHEERIVHSDLKPANFLLVKGSLKLIDFGIAKAIMSDTTNIQRDAQVGTLSYMSPEAFMCNETDANGNIIKCGRPSDIWSLGCILYQMVYGKTPFSDYKTFWSKFKVITDPNHKITYAPVSNPFLLDLMQKCLAWERNDRWRIPQLLNHPFLVPPLHPLPNYPFLHMISDSCNDDNQVSSLCSELRSILGDTTASSRADQVFLLSQLSSICLQLKDLFTKPN